MNIFWRMMLAHMLADFTLQSNHIAAWKRSSWRGMLVHTTMHPALSVALTWPYLGGVWVHVAGWGLNGWICAALNYLTHYLQDEWRVSTIGRRASRDTTGFFFWDQLVHVAVLCVLTPFLSEFLGGYPLIPEKWPVIACLFVAATHFTTVVVYFIEKDFWKGAYPSDREKYRGICERAAVVGLFLLPGFWWAAAAAAWLPWRAWLKTRWSKDFSWPGFAIGAVLTLACGALARWVRYS